MYLLDYPDPVEVSGVTRSQFGHREDYAYLEMWVTTQARTRSTSTTPRVRSSAVTTTGRSASRSPGRRTGHRPTSSSSAAPRRRPGSTCSPTNSRSTRRARAAVIIRSTRRSRPGRTTATPTSRRRFEAILANRSGTRRDAEGRTRAGTVENGLTVQRVVDGIYRSSDRGGTISLEASGESVPLKGVEDESVPLEESYSNN